MRRILPTLIVFLMLSAPAHASRTMQIGIQDDAVFVNQVGYPRQAAFDRAEEIGVTKIARTFSGAGSWPATRPTSAPSPPSCATT